MGETRIIFEISDPLVQKLFRAAEEKCRLNERLFDGRRVLIEGGGYNKVCPAPLRGGAPPVARRRAQGQPRRERHD